jgi:hypothetical protein
MTKPEIEALIQAALEPLQREIAELKAKLEATHPSAISQPTLTREPPNEPVGARHASFSQDSTLRAARAAPLHESPESLPEEQSAIGNLPSANPERTDFQRFLQRGLEEEQVRYSEEAVADKPEPKKGGWNPFRR